MRLKEIYKLKKPVISYEIFPPKGDPEEVNIKIEQLFNELKILSKFNPSFISVTFGAGGSTKERTLELVLKIKKELEISPMPHFTCVGMIKSEVLHYLKLIQEANIENILALRGDPPQGETKFVKPEGGFGYANELVEFIMAKTDLDIAVAGYPEGHQEAESFEADIINLKRKIDAGASIIITQLFYDNNFYFNFVEKAEKAGINIPIVPGILPTTSFTQIKKIPTLCRCTLPQDLVKNLEKHQENNSAMRQIGIEFAINQCRELVKSGVPGLHFYTFNKSFATESILNAISELEYVI